jgi:hypothetical protein
VAHWRIRVGEGGAVFSPGQPAAAQRVAGEALGIETRNRQRLA